MQIAPISFQSRLINGYKQNVTFKNQQRGEKDKETTPSQNPHMPTSMFELPENQDPDGKFQPSLYNDRILDLTYGGAGAS